MPLKEFLLSMLCHVVCRRPALIKQIWLEKCVGEVLIWDRFSQCLVGWWQVDWCGSDELVQMMSSPDHCHCSPHTAGDTSNQADDDGKVLDLRSLCVTPASEAAERNLAFMSQNTKFCSAGCFMRVTDWLGCVWFPQQVMSEYDCEGTRSRCLQNHEIKIQSQSGCLHIKAKCRVHWLW